MVDPVRGLQADVPCFEDRIFRMSTGAIRLAAMAGADVVPCLIAETSSWNFLVHFGKPVPREYFAKSLQTQAIGRHLLDEFSEFVKLYPAQAKMRMTQAMWPLPEEGATSAQQPTAPVAVAH